MTNSSNLDSSAGAFADHTASTTMPNCCEAGAPQAVQGPEAHSFLEAALWYADHGWHVYPCRGKFPAVQEWTTVASADQNVIRSFWNGHPMANIGCVLGAESSIFVLDVDLPEGPSALETLETRHGALPTTWVQRSASGGRHYFFQYPVGATIRTSIKRLAPGLDVLSDNHGVMLTPSRLWNGEVYEWLHREGEIAEAPAWLLDLIAGLETIPTRPGANSACNTADETSAYGFVACVHERKRVEGTLEGGRNDQLNRSAFKLGQLISGGELLEWEAETELRAAARLCGLPDHEAFVTINSGLQAGKKHPRKPSELRKEIQERVKVPIVEGKLPELVDACEGLLLNDKIPLVDRVFQRGASLVTVCNLPAHRTGGGLDIESGTAVIQNLTRHRCLDILGRLGVFEKCNAKNAWIRKDVPEKAADLLLARSGTWKLPVLKGVIESPTLRPDGSLIEEEGYDAASGYILAKPMNIFLHEEPSKADAVAALSELQELLHGFSFMDNVDASVALALILTSVAKPALGAVPLFTVTAPVRGSGKSTLIDIASVISSGRKCAVLAATQDAFELEKRLVGILLAGCAMANIDNINGVLSSDLLCQAITQEYVRVRPLGGSPYQDVPSSTLWVANGNNLCIADDLTRRALVCRIDPGLERPEERDYAFDPVERAKRFRSRYVAIALTVLKAYIAAGSPKMGLTPFGSFEGWSALVRSALVWAGASDPCDSRGYVIENDPSTQNLSALLDALHQAFGLRPFTSKEIIVEAESHSLPLAEVLEEIASEWGERKNAQKLGYWMKKHANRVIEGRKLVKITGASARQAVARWQVVCVISSASQGSPQRD